MAKPGDALRDAGIKAISPYEFLAEQFPNHVLLLGNGGRINNEVAAKLAKAIGIGEKFWLNLQEAYDNQDDWQ